MALDTKTSKTMVDVVLPDLFKLFLSETPPINPSYETIKDMSESWFIKECTLTDNQAVTLKRTDFSYFCAIFVPSAGRSEFRTMCDFGHWVFPFDDLFDNGTFKDDPHGARQVVNGMIAIMDKDQADLNGNFQQHYPKSSYINGILNVFESVWKRVVMDSTIDIQARFSASMKEFLDATLQQVDWRSQDRYPSFDELLVMRRGSAGVSPFFALAEYALKLRLPNTVFENTSIQEIQRIGIDFIVLQNDILSYCKEEAELVPHNLVAVTRYHMQPSQKADELNAQNAFDSVGAVLDRLYKEWFLALANLPSWGEIVDADVQRFIASVRAIVQANLNWSFRSERYFGKRVNEVRHTRIVQVLKNYPIAQ